MSTVSRYQKHGQKSQYPPQVTDNIVLKTHGKLMLPTGRGRRTSQTKHKQRTRTVLFLQNRVVGDRLATMKRVKVKSLIFTEDFDDSGAFAGKQDSYAVP